MTMSDLRCRERHRPGLAGPLLAIPDCHREHSQRRDLEGAVNRQLGRTTMKEEEKLNEAEDAAKKAEESKDDAVADEGEFKLTVRKLEMPVRPRGVLAE